MTTYDTAVVHSWIINIDGTQQPEGARRVAEGAKLYKSNVTETLTMTGWHDQRDWAAPVTHAESMARYAVSQSVPRRFIYTEEKALDTVAQAAFTKWVIAQPKRMKNVAVVTSDYHAPRADEVFRFIYGPDYTMKTFGTETLKKNEPTVIEEEKRCLETFRKFWEGIEAGDDMAISMKLFSKHPLYNGTTKNWLPKRSDFAAYLPENLRRKLATYAPNRKLTA